MFSTANQKTGRGWSGNRRQKTNVKNGVPGIGTSQSQSQASQVFIQMMTEN